MAGGNKVIELDDKDIDPKMIVNNVRGTAVDSQIVIEPNWMKPTKLDDESIGAIKRNSCCIMSLEEIEGRNIQACDILCMIKYPLVSANLVGMLDSDFDSGQRLIFFIPGREAKYVKISK